MSMQTATGRACWLGTATGTLWLVLAGPACWMAGTNGLEGLTYSALLCLLPGWLVFFLGSRYRVANTQAAVILLATTIRLLFVLIGVLLIQSVRSDLRFREFLVWVIVFYLATLLVETLMLIKQPAD